MSMVTDEIRGKATELYQGNDVCLAQSKRLLREVGLPNGLLPLQEVEECGYVEETGFVWVKQKKEIKHKFDKIGKVVSYAKEVTAHVEECKIKKLTGVKAKELLIWVTVNEITIDSPGSQKIYFKNNPTGISKVFPADAFVVEEAEVATKGIATLKKKNTTNNTSNTNNSNNSNNNSNTVDPAKPLEVAQLKEV